MKTVRFANLDVALLYSFPKPASELSKIIWCFTFTHRTYPPTYEELTNCLSKGLKTGIIRRDGELFVIDDTWYDRIHKADDTAENEIESMMEFEDEFVGLDVEATTDDVCALTEGEYESILAKLH